MKKGYFEPEYNEVPVWFRAGCYIGAGITVGLSAALLWCNLASAADAPAMTAAKAQSAGLSGMQTIQAEACDALPQDEPEFYVIAESAGNDELPTDEPVSVSYIFAPAGAAIYEANYEAAEPAKSYNGVAEGDTINATLTYYDVCVGCCGSTQGVTASGQTIYNGMADPHVVALNWLPLGSIVEIDGVEYTVADRGGDTLDTVGRVDVFTPAGHAAALELGKTETTITVVKIGGCSNG